MHIRRRGVGLITSSNFYVPQVNLPGSMASFVLPAGVSSRTVATKSGALGTTPQQMYVLTPNPTTQAPIHITTTAGSQYTPLLLLAGLAAAAYFMRR